MNSLTCSMLGNFMLFVVTDFSRQTFSKKFFQEHHQTVMSNSLEGDWSGQRLYVEPD